MQQTPCELENVSKQNCTKNKDFSFLNFEHYLILPAFLRNNLTFMFKSFMDSPVCDVFLPRETV